MAWIRIAGGILLILLGVLGTLLPVIPGVALILAGLSLIGTVHPPTARVLRRFKRRGTVWFVRKWRALRK